MARVRHWANQISRGVLSKMTEGQAEQTFNNEIFGTVLGDQQVGTALEASLMPKRTGASGKDTPDFVRRLIPRPAQRSGQPLER